MAPPLGIYRRAFFSHLSSYPVQSPKGPRQQITEATKDEQVGRKARTQEPCLSKRPPWGHHVHTKAFCKVCFQAGPDTPPAESSGSNRVPLSLLLFRLLQGLGFLFVLACCYFLVRPVFVSTANEKHGKHLFLQGPKR